MSAKPVVETESAHSAGADVSSARKSRRFLLVLTSVIVALIAVLCGIATHYHANMVTLGSRVIKLEVVDTPATRERGLSGRENLARDMGMLFVFDEPSGYCFWMKDMRFPIDIIWLDGQKRVVDIEKNVVPATYPNSFCSKSPANYVIEVAAGVVDETGLKEDDQVRMHSGLVL